MVKIDKNRAATYVTRAERVKAVNAIKTGSDTLLKCELLHFCT
jgi:hypothetical protein